MIDRKNGDKPITFEVTIGECWAHSGVFRPGGCWVVNVPQAWREGNFDHFPSHVLRHPHSTQCSHERVHTPTAVP